MSNTVHHLLLLINPPDLCISKEVDKARSAINIHTQCPLNIHMSVNLQAIIVNYKRSCSQFAYVVQQPALRYQV